MMRGSMIVFSGVLSVLFLKRKLRGWHWVGIATVVIGLILVGLSVLLTDDDPTGSDDAAPVSSFGSKLLSIFLVLFGMLAQSGQLIVEESYLKDKRLHPVQLTGWEGLIGAVTMCALVLPILHAIPGPDQGSAENALDGVQLIVHTPQLLTFVIVQFIAIPIYNVLALSVTRESAAVIRTMLDAVSTSLVWSAGLFIHYALDPRLGEAWTAMSWLQVVGFLMLIFGTFVYNGVVSELSCCNSGTSDAPGAEPAAQPDDPLLEAPDAAD